MNNEKSYLSPAEVAELLMVSPITVRKWAQKGDLTAVMTPGGHRRFLWSDVEAFARKKGIDLGKVHQQKRRLLIVDDDQVLLGFLVEFFSAYPEQLEVEVAHDGFDAGKKVESFKPDIILLDLMMPKLDGVSVCRNLKSNPLTQSIRILVMTGFPTPENEQNALDAGAEVCLKKPLDNDELLRLVGISDMS